MDDFIIKKQYAMLFEPCQIVQPAAKVGWTDKLQQEAAQAAASRRIVQLPVGRPNAYAIRVKSYVDYNQMFLTLVKLTDLQKQDPITIVMVGSSYDMRSWVKENYFRFPQTWLRRISLYLVQCEETI